MSVRNNVPRSVCNISVTGAWSKLYLYISLHVMFVCEWVFMFISVSGCIDLANNQCTNLSVSIIGTLLAIDLWLLV